MDQSEIVSHALPIAVSDPWLVEEEFGRPRDPDGEWWRVRARPSCPRDTGQDHGCWGIPAIGKAKAETPAAEDAK